jgi:hypothetical protein
VYIRSGSLTLRTGTFKVAHRQDSDQFSWPDWDGYILSLFGQNVLHTSVDFSGDFS